MTSGRAVFDTEHIPRKPSFVFMSPSINPRHLVLVKGLEGRHIIQIASGLQHSIIIDSEGYVLVFGCAGYCRLGLGDQRDALVPKVVPAFSNERAVSRAAAVFAGPTCSAVIDRGGMFWLAGKVRRGYLLDRRYTNRSCL